MPEKSRSLRIKGAAAGASRAFGCIGDRDDSPCRFSADGVQIMNFTSPMPEAAQMLEIRHLVKFFGLLAAVDDVSFSVPRGEVLGFLGPNGAGKSTTMKMITGFLPPDAGTAIVCGHDIRNEPLAAKKRIGYLPEGAPAYPDMTAAEFLGFVARIRGFAVRAR